MTEVGLAAYTDRLSGRPGDSVKFFVSSSTGGSVSARLTRCVCADPNPAGPGCVELDASEHFEVRDFPARRQEVRSGSYARSRDVVALAPEEKGTTASVEIWLFPTTIYGAKEGKLQCIWSWGRLGLHLEPGGRLSLSLDGRGPLAISDRELPAPNGWYRCTATVSSFGDRASLVVERNSRSRKRREVVSRSKVVADVAASENLLPACARFELASGGTFNGRLENPQLLVRCGRGRFRVLACWDTSRRMSEWTVPSSNVALETPLRLNDDVPILRDNPLVLCNHPTRAVRGRLWDGSEFCWRHAPSHYGGVHFHDDDCYDFGWECDMEWTIPRGMPSGIYVARLTNAAGEEEALPLFVCPSLEDVACHEKGGKLCVLISTFTYVMYGNHARSDLQPEKWAERTKDWNAYPNNPFHQPNYGLSTYNFHNDRSGICFASHLRPLFNLRPGYLTFGHTACSGLRHFPADTHLIAFLHHFKIDHDVVTDHELHRDGTAAIAGYRTLITGTHPEYHTRETLDALQEFRDGLGGNLIYLGGNGFYWRVAAADDSASMLEVRRAEGGVRTWASEPGEYYHMLDGGSYGGLWRRNGRPPQRLVGVGFAAQGSFEGMPYRRVCRAKEMEWLFEGIEEEVLGDFGFSGGGAAGFELDRVDRQLDGEDHGIYILAQSFDKDSKFMLVPEEVLTTYSNLSGNSEDEARRSDMVYFRAASGAKVFSTGSITFCGSLPWNNFDNNISTLLQNIIRKFMTSDKSQIGDTQQGPESSILAPP